jgi:hypothetical protein
MQNNWEKPTMAIENRWRFIPIAGRTALSGLHCLCAASLRA